MNLNREKHFIIDIVFVLTLFGVFALSALALVRIGAIVYQRTVSDMQSNYEERVLSSYLTEKVRQHNSLGAVQCGELSGIPALLLSESVGDTTYITYLYEHEGALHELTVREGNDLGGNILNAGQSIIDLDSFEPRQISPELITIRLTDSRGRQEHLFLNVVN